MDDLTGLLLWGGSRLTCIVKTNSPVYLVIISAGNYFYSYIIIPATINHNNVYTITND